MKKNRKSDACIIVATFNRADLIKETLESLLNQTRQVEKIIVIDDGSTDNTREIVAGFGEKIDYIFQENSGKPTAVNRALQHTDAEYVWVFDDDDVALPTALASLIEPLEQDEKLDFTHGGISFFKTDDQGHKVTTLSPQIKNIEPGHHFETLLMGCSMCHIAMLIRRRCYAQLNGMDQQLKRAQDYDILLRLSRQFRGINILQDVIRCRQHEGDRGDLLTRHSNKERFLIQFQFDQIIFRKLREETDILSYIGYSSDQEVTGYDMFSAWLMRSLSMGVHGLWAEYLGDIRHCKEYRKDEIYRLSAQQKENLSMLFSRQIAVKEGMKNKGFPYEIINETLRALGKEAGKPLARGFYWSLKNKDTKLGIAGSLRYITYILYTLLKKSRAE